MSVIGTKSAIGKTSSIFGRDLAGLGKTGNKGKSREHPVDAITEK